MGNQSKPQGWVKASFITGIITTIFSLLPLASAWLMLLTTFNYVLAPLGFIFGIVGLVKSQNATKAIIGMLLCVLALCMPFILAEYYVSSTIDAMDSLIGNYGF